MFRRLAELSQEIREQLNPVRIDTFLEKHEGPFKWEMYLKYYDLEFLNVVGFDVLLPVDNKRHQNMTILRCTESKDGNSLTIILKDTTWEDDPILCGYVAICDRFPDEDFYVAVFYHESYLVENSLFA